MPFMMGGLLCHIACAPVVGFSFSACSSAFRSGEGNDLCISLAKRVFFSIRNRGRFAAATALPKAGCPSANVSVYWEAKTRTRTAR
jgi:hypothetical protein